MNEPLLLGDSLIELKKLDGGSVDLVYMDPPFFTNREHSSVTRNRDERFTFDDTWKSDGEYAIFLEERLIEIRRVLKESGSVYIHCDSSANYLIRAIADRVFGRDNFRSEIIWSYRRWSNSARNYMPSHQTIYFYSKGKDYTFNTVYSDYSESTNVDQLLQMRARDSDGVTAYAKDSDGNVIYGNAKRGVPLSDVWEIPYLNPKAKERVGYPTQKPLLLLERIIEVSTNPGDMVLDPFCGSGTTLVAAKRLARAYCGIDISPEAIALSQSRLSLLIKTESALLNSGRKSYASADPGALAQLDGLDAIPVHRNKGIDAFVRITPRYLLAVRVQRPSEEIGYAVELLKKAMASKSITNGVVIRTSGSLLGEERISVGCIEIIDSAAYSIAKLLQEICANQRVRG